MPGFFFWRGAAGRMAAREMIADPVLLLTAPSATPKMRHAVRRLRHRIDMDGSGVTIPR